MTKVVLFVCFIKRRITRSGVGTKWKGRRLESDGEARGQAGGCGNGKRRDLKGTISKIW